MTPRWVKADNAARAPGQGPDDEENTMPSRPLRITRRTALAATAGLLASSARAQLKSGDNPDASPRWQQVRGTLFKGRTINDKGDTVVSLDAPARADDAAVVPIAIRAGFEQKPDRFIKQVWLIIDNNPSPISAIFEFSPASGSADIETRVRIDEYTFVRAIAELSDGALYMSTRWVKAAGGCSAPPAKDAQAALASLGRMKLRIEAPEAGLRAGQPVLAQLMISHPNHSGLAMDQLSRQYTPAHFVRRIEISDSGRPLLSADVDFSISENPNLRFYFTPREAGELKAEVLDSKDLRFEISLRYRSGV